jgi:hypothetical protein
MTPHRILPALSVLALGAFALSPPAEISLPKEKQLALGSITPAELAKLDVGYQAIERGQADVLAFAESMGQRGAALSAMAETNVANAAAYRAAFADAYLFDEIDPPVIDPPVIDPDPTYGVQVPIADLIDWEAKLVTGGGKPASVDPWASGSTMERFRFHPPAGELYTHKGIASAEKGIVGLTVRDFVVDTYQPWGMNAKAQYTLRLIDGTVRGVYGTGKHIEHGTYLGVEGWPETMVEDLRATCSQIPSEYVDVLTALGDPGPHADVAALEIGGMLYLDNPGGGVQETNRDRLGVDGGFALEATHPETFDADAGSTWIHDSRFSNCGMGHPAATISLFASEHWDSGRTMRRANKVAYVTDCRVEAQALENGTTPRATLLLIAGKRAIYVEGGVYRRGDMGSAHRSFWSFGDAYAGTFSGWDRSGAPATEGGPIVVRDVVMWSGQPTKVSMEVMDGTPIRWSGVSLEDGSADIRLVINGVDVGSVTKDYQQ